MICDLRFGPRYRESAGVQSLGQPLRTKKGNNKVVETKISVGEKPPGIEGTGFFATSLEKVVGLARKNSIWPLPFATSCCGIEFMATMGAHYDLARFGSERLSFSPRQADLRSACRGTTSCRSSVPAPAGIRPSCAARARVACR